VSDERADNRVFLVPPSRFQRVDTHRRLRSRAIWRGGVIILALRLGAFRGTKYMVDARVGTSYRRYSIGAMKSFKLDCQLNQSIATVAQGREQHHG
jgi:hypothetical protein